jgi:hypothetical protein
VWDNVSCCRYGPDRRASNSKRDREVSHFDRRTRCRETSWPAAVKRSSASYKDDVTEQGCMTTLHAFQTSTTIHSHFHLRHLQHCKIITHPSYLRSSPSHYNIQHDYKQDRFCTSLHRRRSHWHSRRLHRASTRCF